MSDYDDGPRRYRSTRTRPRDRGDPDYVQETTYVERGKGPPPRDLVYRPTRDDSVEDIPRDFPPPGGDRYRRDRYYEDNAPRRARSAVGRRNRYRDDDDYSDYDVPAAAGAAGYAAGRARERRRQRRDDRDYDSDSPSPHRHKHERRKSGVGEILEGLGLGGVAGALLGKSKDKDRSRSRDRDRDRDRDHDRDRDYRRDSARHRRRSSSSSGGHSRSRSKGGKSERKWAQAAQAALVAGAVEAFRSRKEPGAWTGEKGRRIATAALGAGGIDGLVDRDPDKKSKRHLAEAVIGGLAANRLANGPRGRSVGPDGRARSRSRSLFGRSLSRGRDQGRGGGGGGGSGLKDLAAGGALAAAGKAIYDRVRSKSRRRRSPSTSSNDSYYQRRPPRSRQPRV
ncbi:hypothetical protein K461DRAFT_280032 [Myriangium duriaei CBS 260.36]|uniref:DUF3824 domain-containing protein n=1 Tax=Myriangium duriaei CBS 260.36 TaxID=1168546 RepID=A0A9P4MIP0_9PEZI|nr:hypothetical protein K461DRAFT_280032 [Myriangium duriaei CBS 260.36]